MADFLRWLLESGIQAAFLIIVLLFVPALMILVLGIATSIDDKIQQ